MKKVKMKKNCLGCRAMESCVDVCTLGYKTESVDMGGKYSGITYQRPLEICPKPMTNKAYVQLSSKGVIK